MRIEPKGFIHRFHPWLSLCQKCLDVLVVLVMLIVSCSLYETPFSVTYQGAAILASMLTLLFMIKVGVYRPRRSSFMWNEVYLILLAWGLVAGTLLSLAWVTQVTDSSFRSVISLWLSVTPFLLVTLHIAGQLLLRVIRSKGLNQKKVAIVGAGKLGIGLAEVLQEIEWSGMQLLGFFDNDAPSPTQSNQNITILGSTSDILRVIDEKKVDIVYIALPMHAEKQILKIYSLLQNTTVSVFLIPDLFAFNLMGARQCFVGNMPAFKLCETPLLGMSALFKRVEDVFISSIALLLMFPFMVLIAIVIRISSPGSIFFQQYRYGLHGETIRVFKFRTMNVSEDGFRISLAKKEDDRITPFGSFLRRTSLDELPQLWNVLRGEMSIVGPRPLAVMVNEEYRNQVQGYMWRHKVKPGITGLAQINGWRGGDTLYRMEQRIACDLDYIRNWSIGLDIKILCGTVRYLLTSKDAY